MDNTENFDGDNIVSGEQDELRRKQKFKNLDEVLDEINYDDLPAQPDLSFSYKDARNTIAINWNTNPENGILRPRGAENILKNVPSPRVAAKYYKRQSNHLGCSSLTKWQITLLDTLIMSFNQFLKGFLMSLKPLPCTLIFV